MMFFNRGIRFCKKIHTVAAEEKYPYLEIQRKSTLSNVFIANDFSASLFTALVNRGFTSVPDLSQKGDNYIYFVCVFGKV